MYIVIIRYIYRWIVQVKEYWFADRREFENFYLPDS